MRVALGFCPHTGWTAAVAVAARDGMPVVLDRRRLELSTPDVPSPVYHAAAGLSPDRAAELVDRAHAIARDTAITAVGALVADLSAAGHEVVAAGVPVGQAIVPTELKRILAAHPMMHAAEGDLFRQVLADAADAHRLQLTQVPTRELAALVVRSLGIDQTSLRALLIEAGRGVGRPWRKDDKDAAMIGWLALPR